ncbi:MAG: hypothetical protein NXI08_16880 [bacterium]|nr:hypothetical protein [bacterium]
MEPGDAALHVLLGPRPFGPPKNKNKNKKKKKKKKKWLGDDFLKFTCSRDGGQGLGEKHSTALATSWRNVDPFGGSPRNAKGHHRNTMNVSF